MNMKSQTRNKTKTFAADFETTVYDGQEFTEVWAAGLCELGTENVLIFNSIDKFFDHIFTKEEKSVTIYFHNLKFDGEFIIYYLLYQLKFKQAFQYNKNSFEDNKYMCNNTFKYVISDKGVWYTITIKHKNRFIYIKDSLKLIPMSLSKAGKGFNTKHRKLELEYEGFRKSGGVITEEEEKYLKNDVLVLKECLEYMFAEGHDKLTIGACCMKEFKQGFDRFDYEHFFPNLYELKINSDAYIGTQGGYILKSYKGGWCYVKKDIQGKQIDHDGFTADVNSLYPFVMSYHYNKPYPVGKGEYYTAQQIKGLNYNDICQVRTMIENLMENEKYVFLRFRTRFYLKEKFLPTIQIKGNHNYKGTEWLETSDFEYNGRHYEVLQWKNGEAVQAVPELTMTCVDFLLMCDHYNIKDFELLDMIVFSTEKGIFDQYIYKYEQIKINAKELGERTEAKLFLNNLYGKMAAKMDNDYKIMLPNEEKGFACFHTIANDKKKKPGYIACGAAITSYARDYTIRAAQSNYDIFLYADTDSIHCLGDPKILSGVKLGSKVFGEWKIENKWDKAIYTRQKTYLEHIIESDGERITPKTEVKCAGMTLKPKNLLSCCLDSVDCKDAKTKEEKDFLEQKLEYKDFCYGLKVPGNLKPKRIPGGVVLQEQYYEMR